MKSLKKTLVLLVVLSMIFSTFVPAFAATDVADLDCEDAVLRMEALDIIAGFEDGTFRPDETITRAQMAVIICKMTGITEAAAEASKNVDSKFSDVKAGDWYTGYINLAAGNGIIAGFPDGTFRPNEVLTLNQVLTLCVKALGRGGYVDQMGTWPANYVTEAARLNLLKDVKGASSANRGNVAIICWNTLRAGTWYVDNETLDGEVSLRDSHKSLLEINFTEYTHTTSTEEGGLKEATATVTSTPARNTEIGDRQIVMTLDEVDGDAVDFDFAAKRDFKKSQLPEKTYTTTDGLVAYVAEEVYEDIDSLRNKKITVIFGDENEVALIVVDSDVVESNFLTRYNKNDNEIVVGGEKYELADLDDLTVIVNDTEVEAIPTTYKAATDATAVAGTTYYKKVDDEYVDLELTTGATVPANSFVVDTTAPAANDDVLEVALTTILGTFTTKTFDKVIEAELTLNEDEDVEKIVMFVSGNYEAAFDTTEVVVKKVKAEKIFTTDGDIAWDADKYEAKDYPRVYVDGARAEITDIQAGDVLTIFGQDTQAKNIKVIYASRKTVEGEVTKVKNDSEIFMDGEAYLPSNVLSTAYMSLNDELKDYTGNTVSSFKTIHGETAVLYMNVLGEYVMVDADTVESDWQFAVVDYIYDADENEEDEDIYTQKLRLVTMEGSKVRNFKLVYDADETYETADDVISKYENGSDIVFGYESDNNGFTLKGEAPDAAKDGMALTGKVVLDAVIAFKANADGEIELDDVVAINVPSLSAAFTSVAHTNDYDIVAVKKATNNVANFDSKRFEVSGIDIDGDGNNDTKRYKVTADTTLLDAQEDKAISWKKLVDETNGNVGADTLLIIENDELVHVIALATPAGVGSDVEYALVLDATYTISNTKTGVQLLGVDGEEHVYEYAGTALADGSLIAYTVSGDELVLHDFDTNTGDSVHEYINIDLVAAVEAEGTEDIYGADAAAWQVESVEDDYIIYADDTDEDFTAVSPRIVDVNTDDVIVVIYELADEDDTIGTLKAGTFDAETLEDAYVLNFEMDNITTNGVELLVVIK